jgi:probable H4MPT-linked C1 transfer pathway protein
VRSNPSPPPPSPKRRGGSRQPDAQARGEPQPPSPKWRGESKKVAMTVPVAKKSVLGLDIGGANLKAAHTGGFTRHTPFALWKNPAGLADALRAIVEAAPPHDALAVTMTGELCDCFESRREGVGAILEAVAAVARTPVRLWTIGGAFIDMDAARRQPLKAASANWLALATFAGRFAPSGPALLIDIGTTTTDVIGLVDGQPVPQGRTDKERLKSGELLYRGWRRTPVCILMEDGAAELFATFHDVYLVLKIVPEDPADRDSADGKPATRSAALRRLARMMCADLESCTQRECQELASLLNLRLVSAIAMTIEQVIEALPGPPRAVIGSGSGEFLLPMVYCSPVGETLPSSSALSLSQRLGPDISAAACAHAVAVLCAEQEG